MQIDIDLSEKVYRENSQRIYELSLKLGKCPECNTKLNSKYCIFCGEDFNNEHKTNRGYQQRL